MVGEGGARSGMAEMCFPNRIHLPYPRQTPMLKYPITRCIALTTYAQQRMTL